MPTLRRSVWLLATVLGAAATARAWSWQHDEATWLAATICPEPFATGADLAVYGTYPDAMGDWDAGPGISLRLFSFEAIDALRAGDRPKALFLASAATHYLTDQACIAHSRAWYKRDGDPFNRFLPQRLQNVRVPRQSKAVYYEHLKGEYRDTVLAVPEPDYNVAQWRRYSGSINAYFDTLPSVKRYATAARLRRPTDWTFTDFDQYARWHATFTALDMLDPGRLDGPQMRLRPALEMKAISLDELLNAAEQCTAYFGYLATAARCRVGPELATVLPETDKCLMLARTAPLVVIAREAPWPVARAAQVLGMELLRAARRLAHLEHRPPPGGQPSDYVRRVGAGDSLTPLAGHSLIALLTPDDAALAQRLRSPAVPAGASGLITAVKDVDGCGPAVILRGASRQDTLYLVDHFLDLAWAPLQARWPVEPAVAAAKELWVGWRLCQDLRQRSGAEAVAYAQTVPHRAPAGVESTFNQRLNQAGGQRGAPQLEWWTWFLLETPLPDGRRVPAMIATGTDYTELIAAVRE